MSYANWFGTAGGEIANNTALTTVTQNGSTFTTTINVAPVMFDAGIVISTLKDEQKTTFYRLSNVPPGLYKGGFWWEVGTAATDTWQPKDYIQFSIVTTYNTCNTNPNPSLYAIGPVSANPFYQGIDSTGTSNNGSVVGSHEGTFYVASNQGPQNVDYYCVLEDFADNAFGHYGIMGKPWIMKIG